MKRLLLILIWVAAVGALSQLFEAGRTWQTAMSPWFVLETLAWAALFVLALLLLMLRSYAVERAKGNVTRPVGWCERILSRSREAGQGLA